VLSLAGIIICLLPLSQFPATNQRAIAAMAQGLGPDYLTKIPQTVQTQMRTQPFMLADSLRGIPNRTVRYTANIPFAMADGVPLNLDIYRPPQVGKYPAIVVLYGGAWQTGSPLNNEAFSRYMAARGYVVWATSYRHAPRYQFPAQLEDVEAALGFLHTHAAEYETDRDRIAILGRSAGAQLAMLTAYRPEMKPVQAVVDYYGPVDLVAGYYNLPKPSPIDIRLVLKRLLGGSPGDFPKQYMLASPIHFPTKSAPPSLLVYGGRDNVVQAKYGRQMHERLQAVGGKVVYLEIPWADHAFDEVFNGISNQLALYYTERFLAWALLST
jgi:acetyl esterase/lipase